jgi:hypothetical protein
MIFYFTLSEDIFLIKFIIIKKIKYKNNKANYVNYNKI